MPWHPGDSETPKGNPGVFLADTFPGMTLRIPLIGQWPPAARFTLGGDAGWLRADPDRTRRIHERAAHLFEACFAEDDPGFVVAQFERPPTMLLDQPVSLDELKAGGRVAVEKARPIASVLVADLAELGPYVGDAILAGAVTRIGANLHGRPAGQNGSSTQMTVPSEGADDQPYLDAFLPVAPRRADYRRLLAATANRETPSEPKVSCQLFFVNTRTALILNIPDDRNLDVVGSTAASVRPLVSTFVDWLVSCHLPLVG